MFMNGFHKTKLMILEIEYVAMQNYIGKRRNMNFENIVLFHNCLKNIRGSYKII